MTNLTYSNELLARFVLHPNRVIEALRISPWTLMDARGEFYLLPNGSKLCCHYWHPHTFYVKGYSKRMFDLDVAWVGQNVLERKS